MKKVVKLAEKGLRNCRRGHWPDNYEPLEWARVISVTGRHDQMNQMIGPGVSSKSTEQHRTRIYANYSSAASSHLLK